MSADNIARETPPSFSAELCTMALDEMRGRPADEQHAELAIMRSRNSSLVALHQTFDNYQDVAKAQRTGAGYLVGHRVLRYATLDEPLPELLPETLRGYVQLVSANPHRLELDVARDYTNHEAVLNMINDGLRFPDSQFGARLIFALYGRMANPGRPSMYIPPTQSGAQQPAGRREQIHRQRR